MARKSNPGRTLTVFFLGVAILFGLVALAGVWKPTLGLDLQGGTRITLVAEGDPTAENLEESRRVIDQRVNGSGVAEAEVVRQGNRYIVVEIPGESRRELVEVVMRQAQLRFRLVACSSDTGGCGSGTTSSDLGSQQGDTGTTAPTAPSTAPTTAPNQGDQGGQQQPNQQTEKQTQKQQSGANRAAPGFARSGTSDEAAASPSAGASPSGDATATTSPEGSATSAPEESELTPKQSFDRAVSFMNGPDQASITAYDNFTCPADGSAAQVKDDASKPLVTCDQDGVKFLLSPAIIEGTSVTDVDYGIPQNDVQYAVTLDFDGEARSMFADATGQIAGTGQRFAIVLDGQVISAPTADQRITSGAQITGDFTEESAQDLANSLKFGALPISFDREATSVESIGPSLAGNQLTAGMWAGAIGLALVLIYCLLYYRALGVVVLGSFAVAAALTYAMVLLLSETAGFTLTLPGIAGFIIAVGVTADSFIIFFERIRDEMRDGKSMRVAVETGWVRARKTRVAANVVQLLSALILYIFASGAVKGFGFALGLTTLIDLAVLFWFTKPLVSTLARYRFFNGGGKLSGLSVETLGVDAEPAPVGGKA
ncbi:protein translocase subunit SecD [Nocardioides insulae]|uniref:protein translocase subunit SecD n=1 Tax=Nocardioides insulae TaxID=394734 RepID=UPI0004249E62|nr:protein translocase subunit SecD [Nocardioides insulae]